MPITNVRKRSVVIAGHKTSISLEPQFFDALKGMARQQQRNIGDLVGEIDSKRPEGTNLSSACRLAVLAHLQVRAAA